MGAMRRIHAAEVRAINSCQVLNSERYVFGKSEALVRRLVGPLVDVGTINSAEVVHRKAKNISDDLRSLIHCFTKSKIAPEWIRRVPLG